MHEIEFQRIRVAVDKYKELGDAVATIDKHLDLLEKARASTLSLTVHTISLSPPSIVFPFSFTDRLVDSISAVLMAERSEIRRVMGSIKCCPGTEVETK